MYPRTALGTYNRPLIKLLYSSMYRYKSLYSLYNCFLSLSVSLSLPMFSAEYNIPGRLVMMKYTFIPRCARLGEFGTTSRFEMNYFETRPNCAESLKKRVSMHILFKIINLWQNQKFRKFRKSTQV